MKNVVIVGAGTGGIMLANALARDLRREVARGAVSLTLVGESDTYVYQPGFLYVAFDLMRPADLIRRVSELLTPGIRFVAERVVNIEADRQRIETASGLVLPYDYLVLATGARPAPEAVPGLAEGAHLFYTLPSALHLRKALHEFDGGRLVVTVDVPHKCPVAPIEFTLMFDEWARERGIRAATEIVYTYPINRPHSIPSVAEWVAPEFEARGIKVETFFNVDSVDPERRRITSCEGTELDYDLLVAIPQHLGDHLGADSGLAGKGKWYPTDRHFLTVGGHDNIFAIGDATDLPVSKAGSVAHFEAEVLTENLEGLLLDGTPPRQRYTGKTFCFIEAGLEKATYIHFDYTHPPVVTPPTSAVHWFKAVYNRVHWANVKAVI